MPPRLSLFVSPKVGKINKDDLRLALLDELRHNSLHGYYKAELLSLAGSLEIERKEPIPTKAGKAYALGIERYSK